MKKNPAKLYYSISEVAEAVNLTEATLRFWEKRFPSIKPRTSAKGTRTYSADDIEEIKKIYHLVKEKGMTLEGAKQRLKHNPEGTDTTLTIIQKLKGVREELITIRDAMNGLS